MEDMLTFFIDKIPAFFTWLASCEIVAGVTLLHFFGALFVILMLLHNLLIRAR